MHKDKVTHSVISVEAFQIQMSMTLKIYSTPRAFNFYPLKSTETKDFRIFSVNSPPPPTELTPPTP